VPILPYRYQSTWLHLTLTVSPTSLNLYLDGVLVISLETTLNQPAVNGAQKLLIGINRNEHYRYFKGKIDENCLQNRFQKEALHLHCF